MAKNDVVTVDVRAVYERTLAALAPSYTLDYVSYDERLSDEQIQRIFHGELQELEVELLDMRRENSYYEQEALRELVPDPIEHAALAASDLWWELVGEIRERDDSDYVGDLMRNTAKWNLLMRYALGKNDVDEPDLPYGREIPAGPNPKFVVRESRRLARLAGVEYEPNEAAFRQMVIEQAWYGGDLHVVWYGSPGPLIEAVCEDEWDRKRRRKISWTDPRLVLLDSVNGSGHDERIRGVITKVWDPSRFSVDSQGYGYGWDTVAGVHGPAYACKWDISPRAASR